MTLLLQAFPAPEDLFAVEPEDLAGILIEEIRANHRDGRFLLNSLLDPFYPIPHGGYPPATKNRAALAIAEAMSWLETQGLIVRDPNQPADWYVLTRRSWAQETRADVEAFRRGRALPLDLLQKPLANKVHGLFLRGDHDTAVFQALKEVEIAVRKAGKFPEDLVGTKLMQSAFNPESGRLTDMTLTASERLSEMYLFAGAIGHAKNPASHRDVNLTREQAARLIVFASHLLNIVAERAPQIKSK